MPKIDVPGVTDSSDPKTEQAEVFLDAARRATDWIAAQQAADGSFCTPQEGTDAYYKIPSALALAGRQHEALRLADWIARHHATPEGDFGGTGHRGSDHERWPTYRNAWLVQGLHRLSRWDLSLPGADFLLTFQLPFGGIWSREGEGRIVEPVCTSWTGLAALTTGHLAAACRAGNALVQLVDQQQDPERFYFRLNPEGRLITTPPEAGMLHACVDAAHPQQIYYNPGIALIFLCHLYRATSDATYLRAAESLFEFCERCEPDVYAFPPSGKLGLGCALLFELTGSAAARAGACRVGEYLVETQDAEGIWRLPDVAPYDAPKFRGNHAIDLDIAAEFSVFLTQIAWRIR